MLKNELSFAKFGVDPAEEKEHSSFIVFHAHLFLVDPLGDPRDLADTFCAILLMVVGGHYFHVF